MKYLTVCEMGKVRSGAMAIALKSREQHDVIQCGWRVNSTETLKMLCDWADAIVVMERDLIDPFRSKVEKTGPLDARKIIIVDVGPDYYGHPMNELLVQYLCSVVDGWKKMNYVLFSALGHRLPLDKS